MPDDEDDMAYAYNLACHRIDRLRRDKTRLLEALNRAYAAGALDQDGVFPDDLKKEMADILENMRRD